MSDQRQLLLDVRQEEDFLSDSRDLQAALVTSRRFVKDVEDAGKPFESAADANAAADAIKSLKLLVDAAEEHRKGIARPYFETNKRIKADYDELLAQPRAAIEVLTKRALAFKRQEEERIRAEEQRLREELQKREEEAAQKAQEAAEQAEAQPDDAEGLERAAVAHRNAATAAMATQQREAGHDAKPKQLRGAFASLGSQTIYEWEVVDLSALPEECKTFNKKVIDAKVRGEKALAKSEGRSFNLQVLPGVRILPKERGVSR